MDDYPKTLMEFEKRFATEESCRDYIFQLRWPNGFECPRCKHNKAWPIGKTLFQCAKCGYQTSVIAGTIFQDTHQGAVSGIHLDYYLDEFTFRFNRRTSEHRGKLFYRLMENAVIIEPIPFKQMIMHVRGPKPKQH